VPANRYFVNFSDDSGTGGAGTDQKTVPEFSGRIEATVQGLFQSPHGIFADNCQNAPTQAPSSQSGTCNALYFGGQIDDQVEFFTTAVVASGLVVHSAVGSSIDVSAFLACDQGVQVGVCNRVLNSLSDSVRKSESTIAIVRTAFESPHLLDATFLQEFSTSVPASAFCQSEEDHLANPIAILGIIVRRKEAAEALGLVWQA
jgi:hypothetical protein